ncbi:MAG: glycosyltransferase [Gloeomargarita sp. SKYBB_i_bin120]|nr:glycosyltransferase [Gloeomargarita sp. SKYG98]MCS7293039.1 glycosyltransferase [Gloeomargarita sp. SKYB120]MDW8178604.1 glycosyltransferase [Gloeomargarita sp. SKYBB_i_bin120]
MVRYSLVVPVYNEAPNLPHLYQRLRPIMDGLDGPAELILVDDGSRDESLTLMRELHQKDWRVCYISLARNFGHQIAVSAGLQFARGQAVVILDADLQDPPELIPDMIALWKQGYQVVYGQRVQRQEHWLKRVCAHIFYRVLAYLSSVEIPRDSGDFCLLDRQVVNILNAMPERNRYVRGLRAWVGFRQTPILYHRPPRYAGQPKYTWLKSFALAMNALVSFSWVPLRLATYLGFLAGLMAVVMLFLVLYWRLFVPDSPLAGYTLIIMAVLFLSAAQLITIGILGEYIGRIYDEVKARPLFTIAEVCGFETNPTHF